MSTINLTHRIVDGQVCRRMVVHKFSVGDVDDPEIYAAQPIWEWQESEMGKFVMENAVEQPELHKQFDIASYGHLYAITAWLREKDITYFCLRWK